MNKIEGIIEIIEDGMKDTRKECMWAEEMMHSGDKESSELFRNEANKRLQGVKEMLEKHAQMLDDPSAATAIAKAWKRRLESEIAERMQKYK